MIGTREGDWLEEGGNGENRLGIRNKEWGKGSYDTKMRKGKTEKEEEGERGL